MASGGPSIPDPQRPYLSFTSLLYAAVIDAALHRFHEPSLSQANVLLIIALLIIVQDYFFYHHDMARLISEEPTSKAKGLHIFLLDILVLGSWYALALASGESYAEFLYYFTFFLFSISLWEVKVSVKVKELFKKPEGKPYRVLLTPIPIMLVAVIASLATKYIGRLHDHELVILASILFLFVIWRLYYWKHLNDSHPSPASEVPSATTTE